MTSPGVPEGRPGAGVRVDARILWSGGAATAGVAALTAVVGVLVCRWLFSIPVLAPRCNDAYGDVHTTGFLLAAAAAALVATGLVHLLLLTIPRPFIFFGWIVGLVTTLAVVYPLTRPPPHREDRNSSGRLGAGGCDRIAYRRGCIPVCREDRHAG